MTNENKDRQAALLDEKIAELNRKIAANERLRDDIKALERRGNREQAFFAGRRSMAYELRESGGLPESRLGLEILYLLPDDFVQFYGALFHRALSVGDSSVMHGRSGGLDKAKGNTGTVTGSDTRLQSSGTGKKFKNTGMTIGSEAMLKLKRDIDNELLRLVTVGKALERQAGGVQGLERSEKSRAGDAKTPQSHQCRNGTCRSFLKESWKFCPRCGTGTSPE